MSSSSDNKKILGNWVCKTVPFSYPLTKVWGRFDSAGQEVFRIIENDGIDNCECIFLPENERVVLSSVNKAKIWCDIKAVERNFVVKNLFKVL